MVYKKKKKRWDRGKVLSFNFNFYFEVIKDSSVLKQKDFPTCMLKCVK